MGEEERDAPRTENSGRVPRGWTWSSVVKVILTVGGLVGAFITVQTLVDYRIETKLRDPEFIRQISPPYLIFDSGGAVHVDSGAAVYIHEKIGTAFVCIEHGSDALLGDLVVEVAVKPKQYLAHAPLLTVLEGSFTGRRVTSHRVEGFDFALRIHIGFDRMQLDSCQGELARRNEILKAIPFRMKLEIVR